MRKDRRNLILDVYDYANHKLCTLYDNASDVSGQATDVVLKTERNGWKELSFVIPSVCETENGLEENFRLEFLKADYRIRMVNDYETDWFILSEPKITHNNFSKNVSVTAGHISQLLKTKNLGLVFSDDEGNNVGTAKELLTTILEGTGWYVGEVAEFTEKYDSSVIKKRSLRASVKTGAFKLISSMCDLFEAKPVYHGDKEITVDEEVIPHARVVDIVPLNPFSEPKNGVPDVTGLGVIELHYGKNISNVTRKLNTENLITKLYAYGAYGDDVEGYCGIDECTHIEYTLNGASKAGQECVFTIKEDNIDGTHYFTPTAACTQVIWSTLDPMSRMYVWDEENNRAYLVTDKPQSSGSDKNEFTQESQTIDKDGQQVTIPVYKKKQNWFSAIMDLGYYYSIGLLTDDDIQAIAKYQRNTPPLLKQVNTASQAFADSLTELSSVIGSVDFCKLDVRSLDSDGGYFALDLNTDTYQGGIIYRTDYDKKFEKRFPWVITDSLKSNGDPINPGSSMMLVIHNTDPVTWDFGYLKKKQIVDGLSYRDVVDDEVPTRLVLWTPHEDGWNATTDKYYLFQSNSINGYLGAYLSADEATVTSLENSTKVVTVPHPVYFYDLHYGAFNLANGYPTQEYAWTWTYNSKNHDDASKGMYFCDPNSGDVGWKRVFIDENVVDIVQEGHYFFNWATSTLYKCIGGTWKPLTDNAAQKRLGSLFGNVLRSCLNRDKYYQGMYQQYVYIPEADLQPGNYALSTGYGYYQLFTIKDNEAVPLGNEMRWDTTTSWVTYKDEHGVEQVCDTKTYRFDNVDYGSVNICANIQIVSGGIDDYGVDDSSATGYRSNFLKVFAVTEHSSDIKGTYTIFCYDRNKNFLGKIVNPNVFFDLPNNTAYIRIASMADISNANIHMALLNAIAVDGQVYRRLSFTVPSTLDDGKPNTLKGILPLMKVFGQMSDTTYGTNLTALQDAQKQVEDAENRIAVLLGDLYREGYWQKNDYVDGDEDKLYMDAIDNLEKLSRPEATYDITYLDLYTSDDVYDSYTMENGIEDPNSGTRWPDISMLSAAHLVDTEIGVNCWAFVDKIEKCYDQPWKTKITINTSLTTISQHSLGDVMTHIAEVASEAKGNMTIYERSKALTGSGKLTADRLQGKIDADTLLITGGSSTWYTDSKGNMVFVSADGLSAMTLTGNGFAIANSKNGYGDWNWRTFGTGDGFVADEIIAGFISGERIEAGSITTDQISSTFGSQLDISSNQSLNLAVTNAVSDIEFSNGENLLRGTTNQKIDAQSSDSIYHIGDVTFNKITNDDTYVTGSVHIESMNDRNYWLYLIFYNDEGDIMGSELDGTVITGSSQGWSNIIGANVPQNTVKMSAYIKASDADNLDFHCYYHSPKLEWGKTATPWNEDVETTKAIARENKSQIEMMEDRIIQSVKVQNWWNNNGASLRQSTVQQTKDDLEIRFTTVEGVANAATENISTINNKLDTYFNFSNDGLVIGKMDDNKELPFSTKITNEELAFLNNGNKVSYISNKKMYISQAEATSSFRIGDFEAIVDTTGSIDWVIVND